MENLQIPIELTFAIPAMVIIFRTLKASRLWKYIRKWVLEIATLIGITISYFYMSADTPILTVVVSGVLLGWSQAGLYETTRKKEDVNNKSVTKSPP